MSDCLAQPIKSIPLSEDASIVDELLRRDLEGIRDRKFSDLHPPSLVFVAALSVDIGSEDETRRDGLHSARHCN